jgi:hypothetical protein
MAVESLLAYSTLQADSGSSSKSLLSVAIDMGFTRLGEMFSASNLATLGRKYYAAAAAHELHFAVHALCPELLAHAISSGALVLVAYDAAANHEPCLARGRSAHWAVIKGIIIAGNSTTATDEPSSSECCGASQALQPSFVSAACELEQYLQHAHFRTYVTHTRWHASQASQMPDVSQEHLYVVAQHGKSKRQCIWSYSRLHSSAYNLHSPDAERASSWIVAETLQEICGKMLIVSKGELQ